MEDIIKYYQINYNKNKVHDNLFNQLPDDLKVYVGSFLNEYNLLKNERKYNLEKYIYQLEKNKYIKMMRKIQDIANFSIGCEWYALNDIEIVFNNKKRPIKRKLYYINANIETNAYIHLKKGVNSNDTLYAYADIKYFKYSHEEHNFIFYPKIYIKSLNKVLFNNNFDYHIIEFYDYELNQYGFKLDKKNHNYYGYNALLTELIKFWKHKL